MECFIMIRGPAGVGKSTVSKILAGYCGFDIIHFDRVMTGYKLGYVQGEKNIPLENFLKANELIIPKLKKQKRVLFDGNFYYKKHIEDLVKQLNRLHSIFTLKASLDECIKRDKSRDKGVLGEKAVRELYELNDFDIGTVIDADKKNAEEVAKMIILKLSLLGLKYDSL